MGNCFSSNGQIERNFADTQARRPPPTTQGAPAFHTTYGHPSEPERQPPPPAFDPLTGKALAAPGYFQPATFPLGAHSLPGVQPFDMNGAPYTDPTQAGANTIKGDGQIARKAGELLIITYDIGTTACKSRSQFSP